MNRAISTVGAAKQTDKATVATNPAYWHGVSSGKMAAIEPKDETADVTTGIGAAALAYRVEAALPTGFSTLAFVKAIGLYILGVLGDVDTTGVSSPYTHVFTMADDVPWITFFSELDGWLQANGASKIDELTLEWDGPKPLRLTIVAAGCTFSLPVSITAPTPDEILGDFFTPVGGTFTGDIDGSTLADWKILGGKISLKRGLTIDYLCDALTPGNIDVGALVSLVTLRVRAASWDDYRTIVTGSASGTAVSADPVIGSFSTKFVHDTDSLTIASSRVKYTAKPVEADPKGGPVELALEGECLAADSTTSPVTVTLVNGVATY